MNASVLIAQTANRVQLISIAYCLLAARGIGSSCLRFGLAGHAKGYGSKRGHTQHCPHPWCLYQHGWGQGGSARATPPTGERESAPGALPSCYFCWGIQGQETACLHTLLLAAKKTGGRARPCQAKLPKGGFRKSSPLRCLGEGTAIFSSAESWVGCLADSMPGQMLHWPPVQRSHSAPIRP